MAPHADEVCRINNGSQNYSVGQMDMAERSYNSKVGFDKTNRSIAEMTRQSGSAYSNMKGGSNQSQSMANIKYGQKAATAMRFNSPPNEMTDQYMHLSGGTVRGGTFSKAHGPKTIKSMSVTAHGNFF
jgi:hypothetical protein